MTPVPRPWFQRQFDLRLPASAFADILSRLKGTPARLADSVSGLPPAQAVLRVNGNWSIQEHVGHLLDLEALWSERVDAFLRGDPELPAADLENRATWEARHNERALTALLAAFGSTRALLVRRLECLDASLLERHALHPRLRKSISLVGHCFFVAEHDDHHLLTIQALRRTREHGAT